jgi:hypothetical protein
LDHGTEVPYKDVDGDARKNQDEAIEDIMLWRGYGSEISEVLTNPPTSGIERDHILPDEFYQSESMTCGTATTHSSRFPQLSLCCSSAH